MIKRVVSFGCSLIYGDELSDWDPGDNRGLYPRDRPSKFVWPQLVANQLGVPHINKGFSGASNEFIYRQLTRYLFYPKLPNYEWKLHGVPQLEVPYEEGDLILIQWTSHARNEVYNQDRQFMAGRNFDHYVQLQVESLSGEQSSDRHVYEKILTWQDKQASAERFLNKMVTTDAMIRSKTNSFVQCFGLAEPGYDAEMLELRESLINNVWSAPGHFLRYAIIEKLPMGKGNHPLEAAHASYADAFLRYYRINEV